jgi:hypothetical protein
LVSVLENGICFYRFETAFKTILRRYSEVAGSSRPMTEVEWCKLRCFATRDASAWFQRLELKCDELPSRFAFNSNLRPYTEVFADGRWTEQAREDRLQLTKCDGQVSLEVEASNPSTLNPKP